MYLTMVQQDLKNWVAHSEELYNSYKHYTLEQIPSGVTLEIVATDHLIAKEEMLIERLLEGSYTAPHEYYLFWM